MSRQRLDRKGVRRVEIEILFKTVGVKEIIANPACWQRWKLPRIKLEFQSLTGAKHDEAIIGSPGA